MNFGLLIAVALVFFILGLAAGLLMAGLREKPGKDRLVLSERDERQEAKTLSARAGEESASTSQQESLGAPSVPAGGQAAQPGAFIEEIAPPPAIQPVSMSAVTAISSLLKAKNAKADEKPASIAAQIDAILQENLPASTLADRQIRLIELPGHQIQVKVGSEQFEGIEAVPYEEVRIFIRQAVAEWEKRATKKV